MRSDYGKLLTQAYDIDKPTAPADELAYYRRFADAAPGPVLEAMCGSGRFLIPLREAGIDIDGMDASPDMLRACEERCRDLGLAVTLYRQELQLLDIERRYALIFCGGGSFGLVADADDARESLRRLHRHLQPGGVLLLEVETPKSLNRGGLWGGRFWRRDDGAIITLRGNLRAVEEELEEGVGIYELFVDGELVETELNEWTRRFWTTDSILAELETAGFVDTRITAAFSDDAPEESAAMFSVVTRRAS